MTITYGGRRYYHDIKKTAGKEVIKKKRKKDLSNKG